MKLVKSTTMPLHWPKRIFASYKSKSLAIPDGLPMDPLAPTALAVSAELMGRLGSGLTLLRDHGKKVQKYVFKNTKEHLLRKATRSVVNVVLIEARDLPDGPEAGSNNVYCKFRLGAECHKTKQVVKTQRPAWRERFNLRLLDDSCLQLAVWNKGKQKNFMGRCTLELSSLPREVTQDLWLQLEGGYGAVHLLVTLSGAVRAAPLDRVPTTPVHHDPPPEEDYVWYRLSDWSSVGQLSVTVHGARGLAGPLGRGRPDAYCVLELDNARVQTHTIGSSDPVWNKKYSFNVTDITSSLELTVRDEYGAAAELGRLAVPLLRVNNAERRWYALKDRACKHSPARGNCPRVLLEMSVVWNPIKASVRVLSPKETKYTAKSAKFDIPLIYSNLVFIKNIFHILQSANEQYKTLFEWESRERSTLALLGWLLFWSCFRMWMTPLLLLAPLVVNWTRHRRDCNNQNLVALTNDDDEENDNKAQKDDKGFMNRINELQDLTFTIKNSIDYLVSVLERVNNLASFAVPYLSFLAAAALLLAALAFYLVPVHYLFMAAGIYKYTRKWLYPDRVPNNDILDFISRVPDNEILKEWRELRVPEPNVSRTNSIKH